MLAGYAVNIRGMDAQALTLDTLTDPVFLWDLSQWWIHERRGEYTLDRDDLWDDARDRHIMDKE